MWLFKRTWSCWYECKHLSDVNITLTSIYHTLHQLAGLLVYLPLKLKLILGLCNWVEGWGMVSIAAMFDMPSIWPNSGSFLLMVLWLDKHTVLSLWPLQKVNRLSHRHVRIAPCYCWFPLTNWAQIEINSFMHSHREHFSRTSVLCINCWPQIYFAFESIVILS